MPRHSLAPAAPHPAVRTDVAGSRRTATAAAVLGALLAAFFVLVAPQPAVAHDSLVSSDPAADAAVETLPAEVTLAYSAELIGGAGSTVVEVTDAAGNSVTDGDPVLDGAVVTQPLVDGAPAGDYTVQWRVVSSDGHPISGEFSFTVTTGSGAGEQPDAESSPSASPSAPATTPPVDGETLAPEAPMTADPPVWPWVVGIVGAILLAAALIWLIVRTRRGDRPGSGDPTGR